MTSESLNEEFNTTHKPINFTEICSPQQAAVMLEVGSKFKMEVTVIAVAGEQYTIPPHRNDQGTLTPEIKAQVPAGMVCVKVFSSLPDLGEFWKEVRATGSTQTTQ